MQLNLLKQEIESLRKKLKIISRTETAETKKLYNDIRDMGSKLEIAQLFNLYYIRLAKAISLIDNDALKDRLMQFLSKNKNMRVFSLLDEYSNSDFLKDKYRTDIGIEVTENLDNMIGFIAFFDNVMCDEEDSEMGSATSPDYF